MVNALRQALAPSVRTVRRNWRPMAVIQAVAVVLVVAYYQSPSLQAWAEGVGRMKVAGGFLFAFVAGLIAGGVVPEVARILTGKIARPYGPQAGRAAWAAIVYGVVGLQVDALYRVLALAFGTGTDPVTALKKTAFDLLVFTPFLSIPTAVALLAWYRDGFASSFWRRAIGRAFYRDQVLASLPLCWSYWGPVLVCTYSLPFSLQFPFAILMESAWSVLFVSLVVDER